MSQVSIIFHGNDIDGWMSAYIITRAIQVQSRSRINFNYYPVSPTKQSSWPNPSIIGGTNLYIVSVYPSKELLTEYEGVAYEILVVDHHASAGSLLTNYQHAIFNTESCSTALLYAKFFPYFPVPTWVGLVDRLSRWQHPTLNDKALREVLHPIACLPLNVSVVTAFERTDDFLAKLVNPMETEILVRQGIDILSMKDEVLSNVMRMGQIVNLSDEQVTAWNIPRSWSGNQVFILNNTGIIIDSTLASAKVFDEYPATNIFVNYRTREIIHPRTGLPVTEYSYSVRARNGTDIDLTKDGVFAGHSCAAGGRYLSGESSVLPFII